jgi:zinc transporter, ZIP family
VRAFAWAAIGASALLVGAFAMLADTLLPDAYAVEGPVTGLLVAVGFALSLVLAAI